MASISQPADSTSDGTSVIFHGDAAAACRRAALFLFVVGPIPAFMLFGQKAVWVFAFGCVPASLFLAGFYYLLNRIDRLEFDDSTEMIVPYVGRPIPYTAVQSLRFESDGSLTRIICRAGAFRRRPLLHAAGADQTAGLRRALAARCPQAGVSGRTRSALKATALVAVLLISLHAGFLYYCRQRWPVAGVSCQKFEWSSATPSQPGLEYELDGMRYSIPIRFESAAGNAGTQTRRFRDHAAGGEIRVHSARLSDWLAASGASAGTGGLQPGRFGLAYLRLLGIHSTYDLMRWPYCDSIGVVPVVLRAALITPGPDPWELKLYEFEHGGGSALIQVESSPGDYSAQILASSESGEDEIMFTVIATKAIEIELIGTLLQGVGFPAK